MSEIPEDILLSAEVALLVCNEFTNSHSRRDVIAKAILAEREANQKRSSQLEEELSQETERCAKIAEERRDAYLDLVAKTQDDEELRRTRCDVYEHSAEAIDIVIGRIRG